MADGITTIASVYIVCMLVAGSGSSLVLKGMNQFPGPICDDCPSTDYNHPYMQTFFMFIGELCCIFVYWAIQLRQKVRGVQPPPVKEGKARYKLFPHIFLFMIPTICDLVGSTLFNIGLYFSQVSVYQMLRNVSVVFVAGMSAILWQDYRRKFDLPQLIGLIVLVGGASLISYAAIGFNSSQENPAKNPGLGIVMILMGCIFSALFYVSEEIFLRKVQVPGLLGVSNEGFWGIVFYAVLLPIFNAVDDPFSDENPKPKMEDIKGWAYRLEHEPALIGLHVAFIACVLVFNFTGMEITNHVSSAARSTFDACRTIIIWIVSFIVGWEKWHNVSTPVRIVGFVLVTLGVLVYNNVFKIIPFLR